MVLPECTVDRMTWGLFVKCVIRLVVSQPNIKLFIVHRRVNLSPITCAFGCFFDNRESDQDSPISCFYLRVNFTLLQRTPQLDCEIIWSKLKEYFPMTNAFRSLSHHRIVLEPTNQQHPLCELGNQMRTVHFIYGDTYSPQIGPIYPISEWLCPSRATICRHCVHGHVYRCLRVLLNRNIGTALEVAWSYSS